MAQEKETTRSRSATGSTLPICSAIPDKGDFRRAKKLLTEALELKTRISADEQELDSIREELAAMCAGYGMPGFRFGLCGYEYHGYVSRKSLSKEKLIALGVDAGTIAEATVEGKEFLSAKIVVFDTE